ncbi:MAG: COX15/CtaA family protein [Candidatus Kariarchaeaceae archaeon]
MDVISRKYQYSVYILAISTYILILLGAYVKAIGAGLACPDWPLCHDKLIPNLSDDLIFAEWFHRLWAALNGFFLLYVFYLSIQYKKTIPQLYGLSGILVILYAVQVIFGGLTVTQNLEPIIVVLHLGNAVLIIILQLTLIFITIMSTNPAQSEKKVAA